jgi:hypothetical protein
MSRRDEDAKRVTLRCGGSGPFIIHCHPPRGDCGDFLSFAPPAIHRGISHIHVVADTLAITFRKHPLTPVTCNHVLRADRLCGRFQCYFCKIVNCRFAPYGYQTGASLLKAKTLA